ncbi:PREDICTED: TNFAIP3-interacting protein 1 [Nanorana parkeri]|uniref:TNFAIP3-interacting protein 1 n=1 Tax=Nanorana parkeri TaxID=125878 RepID=UPI000853F08D|nr:PREDICTED: TNFAIP3-interacting protein 1 [Nanorana parkeri]
MEGRSPYRIYDPGGTAPNRLAALRQNMEGILSLGDLLEESQSVVFTLRQKAEALTKDDQHLQPSSYPAAPSPHPGSMDNEKENADDFLHVRMEKLNVESHTTAKTNQKSPTSGSSSEFEILGHSERRKPLEARLSDPGPNVHHEDENLHHHLQRMENSLSMFAEEPDQNRLLNHISRMVLEFNRLAGKVHKNEMRTSVLQTLCEQLRKENEDLRHKLEADWNKRSQVEQALRYENVELRKLILDKGKAPVNHTTPAVEDKIENATHQQAAKLLEKSTNKDQNGALVKKVKILEHQRTELLEVNKQWDQQFRSMKMQYEEKITSLRQKLSQATKNESEQEAERDRKQRDFDRKLLLARDKLEEKEAQIQKLESDIRDLKQKNKFLHDQLSSTSKQREYHEREISRLNKALEEALKLRELASHSPSITASAEDTWFLQRQELLTQNDLLKQQVTIFEEDFKRERSDRERMNEEKEELKRQLEHLQAQLAQAKAQLRACQEDMRREREGPRDMTRQQALGERYNQDPHTGPACPPYQYHQYPYSPPALIYQGFDDWQICYPPQNVAPEHSQVQDLPNAPPPVYQWKTPNAPPRSHKPKEAEMLNSRKKEQEVKRGTQIPQRPT